MSSPAAPDGALKPSLGVFDVVAITVSAVTPASSVFVIAPFAIQQAGSGAFLAFVMAAALALMFAWCYAELGRAHSSAGGEYVYAKRVFGGMAGYATFLAVLVSTAWMMIHRFRLAWLEDQAEAAFLDTAVAERRQEAGVSPA